MNRRQFINYLRTHDEIEDSWIQENEKDLKKIVSFIWEAFIYTPRIINFVNKHVNTYDFNSFKLKDKIEFIHFIIKQSKPAISWLNFDFFSRIKRVKEYELYKEIPDNDKRALWHLENEYKLFESNSIKSGYEKPRKLTAEEKKKIELVVRDHETESSSTEILTTLNQEIIEEKDLSLFDISVIDSRNLIQYTFLDKNNKKVVYREPYKMKIKFHPSSSIFDKDYFEPVENLYEYVFTSVWDYMKFRKVLNQAFLNSLRV